MARILRSIEWSYVGAVVADALQVACILAAVMAGLFLIGSYMEPIAPTLLPVAEPLP